MWLQVRLYKWSACSGKVQAGPLPCATLNFKGALPCMKADLATVLAQLLKSSQTGHIDGWLADDGGVQLLLRPCSAIVLSHSVDPSALYMR